MVCKHYQRKEILFKSEYCFHLLPDSLSSFRYERSKVHIPLGPVFLSRIWKGFSPSETTKIILDNNISLKTLSKKCCDCQSTFQDPFTFITTWCRYWSSILSSTQMSFSFVSNSLTFITKHQNKWKSNLNQKKIEPQPRFLKISQSKLLVSDQQTLLNPLTQIFFLTRLVNTFTWLKIIFMLMDKIFWVQSSQFFCMFSQFV